MTPVGKTPSPVVAARIIADRIVNSDLSAAQIQRLAKLELGQKWPEGDLQPLEQLSRVLRSGADSVAAITRYGKEIRGRYWGLIENDLLQREFAWPLVVAKDRDGKFVECSLPIGIHVTMDGSVGQLPSAITGQVKINAVGWRQPLRQALEAAKQLWIYKHTSWDERFVRRVMDAKVVLDLSIAERIVAPFTEFCDFQLDDDSHGAYLAAIIASRLFDDAAVDTVCATGALGDPIPDSSGDGSDYWVRAVAGTDAKLAYAEAASFFDQIVIPKCDDDTSRPCPGLRVNRGDKLSDYVEHIAGQSWRKHRYVRAPDFHTDFRNFSRKRRREGVLPSAEQEVRIQRALNHIKNSSSPVVTFNGDIQSSDVADALYRINDRASGFGTNNRGLANYTVVRAVVGESYDRFWQTVWEALEGGRGDFERISLFSSAETVAGLIAGRLNWFKPTPDRPRRAPDFLVILDYDQLPKVRGVAGGPDARLSLETLVPHLEDRLLSCPNDYVRNEVGCARILLVPAASLKATKGLISTEESSALAQGTEEGGFEAAVIDDPVAITALRRLAVFRNGFTWEMARRMCELPDREFSQVLGYLEGLEGLRGPLIRFASGAVEYYVTDARQYRDAEEADLHYRAAQAILGFLERDVKGDRLDVALGLSTRWRHEAQWHLRSARQLSPSEYLKQRCRLAQERLNRIAEPLSWSRLRWAADRSGEEGLETWDAFAERLRSSRDLPHPFELLMMARFAHRIRNFESGRKEELIAARDHLAERAMLECNKLALPESDSCRFVIASTQAVFMTEEMPSLQGWRWATRYNKIARDTLQQAVEVYDPIWYELEGDHRGHVDYSLPELSYLQPQQREVLRRAAMSAAPLYRLGFLNSRVHGANFLSIPHLVKWLGAMEEACLQVGEEERKIARGLNPKQRKWFAEKRRIVTGLSELQSVKHRWHRGCKQLDLIILGQYDYVS